MPRESLKLVIQGGDPGMTDYEALPIESATRRCPRCTASFRLTRSILDSQRGNTVHVFQCVACGECLWDDNSEQLAAGFSHLSSSRRNDTEALPPGDPRRFFWGHRLEEDHIEIVGSKCILNPEAQGPTIHELAANCPAPKVQK